jgi:hypothetical protein
LGINLGKIPRIFLYQGFFYTKDFFIPRIFLYQGFLPRKFLVQTELIAWRELVFFLNCAPNHDSGYILDRFTDFFFVESPSTQQNKLGRSIDRAALIVYRRKSVLNSVPYQELSSFLDSCSFVSLGLVVHFFFFYGFSFK